MLESLLGLGQSGRNQNLARSRPSEGVVRATGAWSHQKSCLELIYDVSGAFGTIWGVPGRKNRHGGSTSEYIAPGLLCNIDNIMFGPGYYTRLYF